MLEHTYIPLLCFICGKTSHYFLRSVTSDSPFLRFPLVDDGNALFEVLEKGDYGYGFGCFLGGAIEGGEEVKEDGVGDGGWSDVLMTPHIGFVGEKTMWKWWV